MTVATGFPSPAVYARAVQIPGRFHQSLQQCQTRDGVVAGLPLSFTGANAIVFPMDDNDGAWALRFFTNPDAADARRYSALERFQNQAGLPWPARCSWLDRAIRIGDDWFPGLRMELIENVLLDQYVLQLAGNDDSSSLLALAEDWRRMVGDMQTAGFAHGDLQHGNVLVEQATGSLRLVDFDGIWLEELAQDPPNERGHGSYQHPGRLTAEHWGPRVDTFSALLVYLSLKALAADPELRRHTVIGSRLLISEAELKAVSGSGAPVLTELSRSTDRDVAALTATLVDWLQGPANRDTTLDQLLDGLDSGPAVTNGGVPGSPVGSDAGPAQWWETTGTTKNGAARRSRPVVPSSAPEPSPIPAPTSAAGVTPPTSAPQARELPSVNQIRGHVAASAERDPSPVATSGRSRVTTGTTGDRGSNSPTPIAHQPAGSSPTGGLAGGVQTTGRADQIGAGPSRVEILGQRALAALVDATLGLLLILHLVWLFDGVVPGKRAAGLAVERTSGDAPGYGRLLVRELLLKQVPVDLALFGLFIGLPALTAVAVGWLALGAVLALGPAGKPIWDHLCDTTVVLADGSTARAAQRPQAPIGAAAPETAIDQTGAQWW